MLALGLLERISADYERNFLSGCVTDEGAIFDVLCINITRKDECAGV